MADPDSHDEAAEGASLLRSRPKNLTEAVVRECASPRQNGLQLFAKVGPSEKVQEIRSMRCDMVNGVRTGHLPRYGDVQVVGVQALKLEAWCIVDVR
jgi:hypothetical protein